MGPEEISSDIPSVSDTYLSKLDESGIVYMGANVKGGDILVGKVTPKGESQLTPEEKLLRAIFGEKASNVKDSSLRVPAGVSGTVIGVQVFTRDGITKDPRTESIEKEVLLREQKDIDDQFSLKKEDVLSELRSTLAKQKLAKSHSKIGQKGDTLSAKQLDESDETILKAIVVDNHKVMEKHAIALQMLEQLDHEYSEAVEALRLKYAQGDDFLLAF